MPFVGTDTETFKFQPGWMVPRQVCTTLGVARSDSPWLDRLLEPVPAAHVLRREFRVNGETYDTALLDRRGASIAWPLLVEDPEAHLVFHNMAYDLLGAVQNFPDATLGVLKAINDGRVWDTAHRERLKNNASGNLRWQPDPWTGKLTDRKIYALATLAKRYLDVDLTEEKSDPDAWRLRYAELDGVPLAEWPEPAIVYALMDAVYPLPILANQDAALPAVYHVEHPTRCTIWSEPSPPLPGVPGGIRRFAGEYHLAISALPFNSAAVWGLRTDPKRVDQTLQAWAEEAERGVEIGKAAGFIRDKPGHKQDGTRDMKALAALTAEAYGGIPQDLELARRLFAERNFRDPSSKEDQKEAKAILKDLDARARRKLVREVCRDLDLDDDLYTDTGKISTRHDVLATCGDPQLEGYSDCTAAVKYTTNWETALREGTQIPITYGIDPLKSTGRISVFGRLYHQIPKKGRTREAHRPRPGWCYVMADYSTLELCTAAQVQKTLGLGTDMLDAIKAGKDLHVMVGYGLMNEDGVPCPDGGSWTYEAAMRARRGEYGDELKTLVNGTYRQTGKGANFGLLGGLGARTFVKYCKGMGLHDIDVAKAERVKRIWGETFPSNLAYLAYIGELLEFADTTAIKQLCSGRVRGNVMYTFAANSYFQGLAADGFAMAAWKIFQESVGQPDSDLFGARMVVPLHDEFILESPLDRFREVARGLERCMVDGMQLATPDVPIKAEAAASLIWSKDVEPVYDVEGRLQLWEPSTP